MGKPVLARVSNILGRYAMAIAGLGVAAVLALLILHFKLPRVTLAYGFLLAIIGSAWWGGYGPGIFTSLATLLFGPYLVQPAYSIRHANLTDAPQILLISILISWMAATRSKLREANDRLDARVRQRTSELERANSALQEHQALLIRQAEELSQSNADLEQFAYVASHDLQEPLRIIAIYSEMLRNQISGKLDEKSSYYLQTVLDAALRMQRLVHDLLAYSRTIQAEPMEVDEVDSAEALQEALSNLEALIKTSNAVIESSGLPKVSGSRVQLIQIFQNLISNALKYRGDRPLRVTITASRLSGEWIFSVRDNGVGIHPDYHEAIFRPFKRLHGQQYPGSGVGLAICRRIIERSGGRIWVESQPALGATFYFALPAETSSKSLISSPAAS